jgi:hypothetical protein
MQTIQSSQSGPANAIQSIRPGQSRVALAAKANPGRSICTGTSWPVKRTQGFRARGPSPPQPHLTASLGFPAGTGPCARAFTRDLR